LSANGASCCSSFFILHSCPCSLADPRICCAVHRLCHRQNCAFQLWSRGGVQWSTGEGVCRLVAASLTPPLFCSPRFQVLLLGQGVSREGLWDEPGEAPLSLLLSVGGLHTPIHPPSPCSSVCVVLHLAEAGGSGVLLRPHPDHAQVWGAAVVQEGALGSPVPAVSELKEEQGAGGWCRSHRRGPMYKGDWRGFQNNTQKF
jgi:hypothetical protein